MSEHDIAIIGMAARFPGASSIDAFWVNLRDGIESIRTLTDEELLDAGVAASALSDPAYVKACPILDDVDQFDASFFGLSPRDAEVMDPAHRLFLEVAWEALEHAGRTGLPDEDLVGVFAGSGAPYYLMDHVRRNARVMRSMGEFLVRHTNNDMNFLSSRVSYELDLRGPSINIQTACSTALVSVHLACESIRRGECTIALAGGSTVILPDRHGYQYHEGEILSPDGHCRPFDERSAGTVFGSGSGCLVLKRLSVALDDGDTVHAVIKGSAVNNDGALRVGFLAPGVDGQVAVIGRALDDASVPAESITYVEAHGTGTSVGDPIEVTALNQAFAARTNKRRYCALGSVKSNIGHLGEAAGVASIIKVVLALRHRQIPASLGFERPNPQIDFDDSPFFVASERRPWLAEGPLRAAVTALGAGGTNCHVILEEAPPLLAGEGARSAQLLTLSARSAGALERARRRLAERLASNTELDIADAAYTLSVGRRPLAHRHGIVARDREHAIALLREPAAKLSIAHTGEQAPRPVVFLFPGGGAQYARMGADLYRSERVFRESADACLTLANAGLGRDLGMLMFHDATPEPHAARELERPSLTMPALFTCEYALARLFQSWGIAPHAMLGHSMGEYVAACLAGVMSLEDALQLVMLRGRLFEATAPGTMLSVPLAESALRQIMSADLTVAAVNAPELCVASGPVASIDALAHALAARDIECTRIRIDVAAHSALLEPILPEFRRFCRTIALKPPVVPFLSNVSGDWITAAEATDPEYWVTHLRSTVRFADCLATLRTDSEPVLLEVGPGRTLSMLARAQQSPAPHAFNAMRHVDESTSDVEFALSTLGKLWLAGAHVDWTALYDGQLRNRVPLPTYAWDHQRHWIDAPSASAAVEPDAVATAGDRRDRVGDWFARPVWRQLVALPPATRSDERVLLFATRTTFSEAMRAHLTATGRHVLTVYAADAWSQSDNTFSIRPAVGDDYERLLNAVTIDGTLPPRVVHMWGVTESETADPLARMMEHGFHSLLCFGQALASTNPDAAFALYTVTSDLQRVGDESRLEPAKALLLGPTRVIPREYPNVIARAIDIVMPTSDARTQRLAAQLATEILSDVPIETLALRGMERYQQVLEPVQLDPIASRLRTQGVYLITGGLGGIGLDLAKFLASSYRAKLLLVGRSANSSRSRAAVAELEAAGGEVEVVQADVTSDEQMRTVMARAHSRFGALHGVFHVAGTLNDSLFPFKSADDADRVLAPKVQGTLALDRAIGDAPLDLFVLFSSISSIAGLAGQSDYTSANAFLDAFAHERSARDGSYVVAINWSAWRDVGMAARIGANATGGAAHDATHPMLGRRIWSGNDAELFAADLTTASHWVVGEHRIRGGPSLMPGTGHLEVVHAAAHTSAMPGILEIRDLSFLSALAVPDDASTEMRVHVAPLVDGRRAIAIAGKVGVNGSASWREHVTANIGFVDDARPLPLDLHTIAGRCTVRVETFAANQESVNMAFGPRWKNLQSIRYGRNEALVDLALSTEFRDDLEAYALHPALMDMATGRCEALIPGFDPAVDFYVPLSYTRVRVFGPLPARVVSHVRVAPNDFDPRELLVFNVTIADEQGRVLVDVDEFMMTRVTDKSQLNGSSTRVASRRARPLFEAPPPAVMPPMVEGLDTGIRSAEGMHALEHVLAGPALAQIFATPQPATSLIKTLRLPAVRITPAADGPSTAPAPPVSDIEAVLALHEAVQECVVMQRANKQGEPKLVAYPVFQRGARATGSELRRYLKARLPENRVPSTFVELDALPRLANGAVDRAALTDPFGVTDEHVAPRTPTEALIAEIWKDILGVNRVSVHDNFFDAGGHSLLAVRAIVRIDKAVGVRLNQAIMVLQTLEQIAAECDRRRANVS